VFDVFPKDVDQADAHGKFINGDQIDIPATRVRDSDKGLMPSTAPPPTPPRSAPSPLAISSRLGLRCVRWRRFRDGRQLSQRPAWGPRCRQQSLRHHYGRLLH